MPRFAANLSLLFTEFPYLERFEAAARAGFRAVEILFPYEFPAGETRRALISNDLELVLINAPPPNYTGGEQGFAGVPGGEARFQYDMRRVMRFAGEFHPGVIHLMSGTARTQRRWMYWCRTCNGRRIWRRCSNSPSNR